MSLGTDDTEPLYFIGNGGGNTGVLPKQIKTAGLANQDLLDDVALSADGQLVFPLRYASRMIVAFTKGTGVQTTRGVDFVPTSQKVITCTPQEYKDYERTWAKQANISILHDPTKLFTLTDGTQGAYVIRTAHDPESYTVKVTKTFEIYGE